MTPNEPNTRYQIWIYSVYLGKYPMINASVIWLYCIKFYTQIELYQINKVFHCERSITETEDTLPYQRAYYSLHLKK